jgi:hypothetical protein
MIEKKGMTTAGTTDEALMTLSAKGNRLAFE